jgi:glyoxylase-like metal-dependent hydrolase (beta-lactamase superfamily II)
VATATVMPTRGARRTGAPAWHDPPAVHHMRVLRPADGIVAFYDGRVEGYRFAEGLNWVDDGALGLGIASYAIVDGDEAVVYDTHVTVEHARFVRRTLEARGVTRFVVVLSHKHLDHVAGTEAFADCEVVATTRTAEALADRKDAIEAGTLAGPPGIAPLVLPTRTFEDHMTLDVGRRRLELIHVDIHSDDAAVLWLPAERLLFAGDTLEDTVTYVSEPEGLDRHLAGLDALAALDPDRILPNHGDPAVIAAGGYPKGLIDATRDYLHKLRRMPDEPDLRATPLTELIAADVAAGRLTYYPPYEEVHRENVAAVTTSAP